MQQTIAAPPYNTRQHAYEVVLVNPHNANSPSIEALQINRAF
jgi:hypothetical protein